MVVIMDKLNELKLNIRENDVPFFNDDELLYYLTKYKTVERASYECLIIKSEINSLNISGLSTQDNSLYFRRLAERFRPNNSGILGSE